MNILISTGIFPPDVGGPANFLPQLCEKISEENKITVITLSDKKYEQNGQYKVIGINRNQNKILRTLFIIYSVIKFGKKADLIFINGLWFETNIANLFLRKKTIRKIVGDPVWERYLNKDGKLADFDTFQNNFIDSKTFVNKFIRDFFVRKSNIIIVPSTHLENFVRKNCRYNGEIIKIFNGTRITKEQISKKNKNNFLVVSRLVKQKNLENTLLAFSEIIKNNLKFELNIVGVGPEFENLLSITNELKLNDYVKFHGKKFEKELEKLYIEADYFIQVSSYEGMSHSILEAINYENLIITSNFPGNTEILDNNLYGIIQKLNNNGSFNYKDLALKIQKLMHENQDKNIKTEIAKKTLVNNHNIEDIIMQYVNILKNEIS